MRRLVIMLAAGAAAAAFAGEAQGALCNSAATVKLNIGAAAAVPALKGNKLSTFGAGEARSQAARLTSGGGNICKGRPSAATARALARVDTLVRNGRRTEAKAALKTLFDELKRDRSRYLSSAPDSVRRSAAACPDQNGHISLAGIKGVADNLALAEKAAGLGDGALAEKAMDAARSAFKAWVQTPANKAATVGDWLRIVRSAEQLGTRQVVTYAEGRARKQASADVKKAAKIDKCTVSKSDFDCWIHMIATAQLVGAFQDSDLAASAEFGKAIEDRIQNVAPDGCEEWTLTVRMTMRMKNNGSEWNIVWGAGKFRINREEGVLDGSYKAGYVPEGGWPGIIGDGVDDCIEESDSGRINHGPARFTGSGFHYRIEGTISGDEIELQTPSDDAKVSVTAPPNIGCQVVAGLGQFVIDSFVKAGIPLAFTATRTQETASYDFSGDGFTLTSKIVRTPLVKP